MAAQNTSVFRSGVAEFPPILTPENSLTSAKTAVSFVQHESQSSITSNESQSAHDSDAATSKSSATQSDSAVAEEKATDSATAVADASMASAESRKNVKVKYSLEVFNTSENDWNIVTRDDEAFDLSHINDPDAKGNGTNEKRALVFEVITQAVGFDKRQRKMDGKNELDEKAKSPPSMGSPLTPAKFEDLKVTEVEACRIEIHSERLLDAIREVVDYYPNQNLSGDVVIIHEPFGVLIHHEKELRNLHQEISSPSNKEGDADGQKAEHLGILLDFMQPHIDRLVPPIQRRLQNKVPTITFDALWYLLKPGTLAYCQYAGEWIGCVIMRVKGKVERKSISKKIVRCNIHVWFLSFSGGLFRAYTTTGSPEFQTKHSIQRYEGEQDVTTLKVVPKEFWDAIDNGARREQFEARGWRKVKLMNPVFQQMSHKGESLEKRKRLYQGPVILDQQLDIEVSQKSVSLWQWDGEEELHDDIWINKRGTASSQRISKLVNLLKLEDNDPEKLSKDQAWLMSPSISCFALDIKSWCVTHIDRLSPLQETVAPTEIVMEESHLKIIKSLTASQNSTKAAWAADSIKGKGKGVIILLHGPPGVGKTYSVECTALAIKRPLLALTIADIGIKESSIETELASWFYLAERWKAVLLIDEADIFLERRKHTDLARNGIVSVFLRKMEYFSGLLFLTTNRVGHIDEAFMSRVHVVIEYPTLDDAKRRLLWEGFFKKMRADTNGGIREHKSAKEYVMQDGSKLGIELNGREIRNALQTAIALAAFEAKEDANYCEDDKITVLKEHFERVLSMSRGFRDYLDSVKGDSKEERATNFYGRNDSRALAENI